MIATENNHPSSGSVDERLTSQHIILRFWLQQRRKEVVAFLEKINEEISALTHEIDGTRPPRGKISRPETLQQVFQKAGR